MTIPILWTISLLLNGAKSEARSHCQASRSTILSDINVIFVIDMPNPITYPVTFKNLTSIIPPNAILPSFVKAIGNFQPWKDNYVSRHSETHDGDTTKEELSNGNKQWLVMTRNDKKKYLSSRGRKSKNVEFSLKSRICMEVVRLFHRVLISWWLYRTLLCLYGQKEVQRLIMKSTMKRC